MEKESKETEYNRTISSKEKHNPKYKEFVEWCLANGMKWTGVDFPAFFGAEGHLRGVVTTRDIKPYEAIIAIPNKILMTTIQAKEDKYLGKLIKAHPDVFLVEEAGEYNILIAMLLRERAKGSYIMS
jgi:hypothetical protein